MVALENRFFRTTNASIYSQTVCDYAFWKRYLMVFEEVLVFARVADISEKSLNKPAANGPNVSFVPVPTFIGPWQYLRKYLSLNAIAKRSISEAQAYILRIPGTVSALLGHQLDKNNIPYGVEVVGNAEDSLSAGAVRSVLLPAARYLLTRNQKMRCQRAVATAYVSERYLQHHFPPGSWSTHYSSIELLNDAIMNQKEFSKRLASLHQAAQDQRPFRICHVGTMSTLYKAQDIVIQAVAICQQQGHPVQLTLIGDGEYQRFFMEKAKELGVTELVKFLGRLTPGQAIVSQLDSADMFVLPSLTEGLPRSLIEAMARGLPCLGTNVGGIVELLPEQDTIKPKNAQRLAQRIMALMGNPQELCQMASRNLEKAKEYRSSVLTKRRVEFYRKVAEGAKALALS